MRRVMAAVVADADRPLDIRRRRMEWSGRRRVIGVRYRYALVGSVRARSAVPARRPVERRVLWFHGGGYTMGSPTTHLPVAGLLAKRAAAEVTLPRYRLAPEQPFPAAYDDALEACRSFLALHDPAKVVIGGDSAGGGVALAAVCGLRDGGGPVPAGLYLQSPWTDLTGSGDCMVRNLASDPFVTRELFDETVRLYLAGHDPSDPRASPLLADHHGLPPTLIQAGSVEALLSDSTRLAASLQRAGGDVTLDVAEEMWHVYPQAVGFMPEALRAFTQGVEFILDRTGH